MSGTQNASLNWAVPMAPTNPTRLSGGRRLDCTSLFAITLDPSTGVTGWLLLSWSYCGNGALISVVSQANTGVALRAEVMSAKYGNRSLRERRWVQPHVPLLCPFACNHLVATLLGKLQVKGVDRGFVQLTCCDYVGEDCSFFWLLLHNRSY